MRTTNRMSGMAGTHAMRSSGLALVLALALTACGGEDSQAVQAQQAAANEAKAKESAAAFDKAVSEENWGLAKAQADVLLHDFPGTEAAKRVQGEYDAVKQKADVAHESARMAVLWNYVTQDVKGGKQRSAAIYSKDEVDVDGTGPTPVRLIFRDHPSWGRSSYLVLQTGDFDCYRGCKVMVTVDDKPAKALPASRPKTDEAIAMFIDDQRSLWRMTKEAKVLTIEFPARGMGKRTAVFEVGGLERSRMPWD